MLTRLCNLCLLILNWGVQVRSDKIQKKHHVPFPCFPSFFSGTSESSETTPDMSSRCSAPSCYAPCSCCAPTLCVGCTLPAGLLPLGAPSLVLGSWAWPCRCAGAGWSRVAPCSQWGMARPAEQQAAVCSAPGARIHLIQLLCFLPCMCWHSPCLCM